MNINRILKGWLMVAVAALTLLGVSCTKDTVDVRQDDQGTLLTLGASFRQMTRLAELTEPADMADDKGLGLKNIGLYVYYTNEYNANDLSQPYVRNLECTVENGLVVPANASGLDKNIYIYDRMTVVAFYPYNPDTPDFMVKADEDKYYITKDDYSEQYYIPYRAATETDPTKAFYTRLEFFPRHTFKIEVVLVGNDLAELPDDPDIKILPEIDPVDNPNLSTDDRREKWYDIIVPYPNDAGGFPLKQYTAYIWTKKEGRENEIKKGTVIFQSDKLTLISSQDMNIQEDYVYRYGYNLNTGEIFIPTSTNLVHDAKTLAAVNGAGNSSFFQVCDIDLSIKSPWAPLHIVSSRYDGGGHQIKNLNVSGDMDEAGLFGSAIGNSVICNVNLVEPAINVTSSADSCYVGAVCGQLNGPLSDADKMKLIGNLPEGLSEVVKQALIDELLESIMNSTSDIVACRVENPQITVSGTTPHVGAIVGRAGHKDDEGSYSSRIWDTYSLDGVLNVNGGSPASNEGGYVGGFAGLNNGTILYSYTTIDDITAQKEVEGPGDPPVITTEDMYTGFTTSGADGSVTDSFTMLADNGSGVTLFADGWPSWSPYTDWWPIMGTAWIGAPSTLYWYDLGAQGNPAIYPTLQWQRR